MSSPFLPFYLFLIGVVPQPSAPLATANAVLDAALMRAWEADDPRYLVKQTVYTMGRIDPAGTVEPIRTASRRLAGIMTLAPVATSTYGPMAEAVAPYDRALRDELLQRAIDEAREALEDEALWQVDAPPGPVRESARKARYCDWLNLDCRRRLWQAILDREAGKPSADDDLKQLLQTACDMSSRTFGGYVRAQFDVDIAHRLTSLDFPLMLKVMNEAWGEAKLAHHCGYYGAHRWNGGQRDAHARELVHFAVDHGNRMPFTLKALAEIDAAQAWRLSLDPRVPPRDLQEVQVHIIKRLAWHDLDAALAVAESERNVDFRRELLSNVAAAWAAQRPESIERAIKQQDNAVRQVWAREAAAEVLARRTAGEAAWDKAKLLRESDRVYEKDMEPFGPRRPKPHSPDPQVVRVLEDPHNTSWLVGEKRQDYLNQAGWTAYCETATLAGIAEILAGIGDAKERDHVRRYNAMRIAEQGHPVHAKELLDQFESPTYSANVASYVAQQLAKRAQKGLNQSL